MKKLSILFAFLCASLMGWAYTTDPDTWIGTTDATYANQFKWSVLDGIATPNDVVNIQQPGFATAIGIYMNFADAAFDGVYMNGVLTTNGTEYKQDGAGIVVYLSALTAKNTEVLIKQGSTTRFGLNIYNDKGTESSSKLSPELSLNATSKTLEIDASAETFQILASKSGTGALSYSSSAEGVATVSNTGLVTAVSAGTATITVTVAEDDDYATESKTLSVEVIDWSSKSWLDGSGDSYKLHISPAMGGTQRIDNGNLWVEFPDAVIGDLSIEPNGGEGAWRTFAPSNFIGSRTQFTAVWRENTYTFTVYRKFDGVNLAKGMPVNAGINPAGANGSNDGNIDSRWQSAGARHYAEAGDMTEDWWYVDLGAVYSIDQIKILYERACATDYDLQTSPNGDSWVNIGSYNAQPNTKEDNDGAYEVYSITPAKNARYVRIFTRNGYSNLAYGFAMYEFEVYGEPAESYDMNAPVLESAAVSGTPTASQVQIAVSATDAESAVTIYRVKDTSHGIDHNCTVAAGVITIDGLTEGTNYSFTITALDAIGNQSDPIVVNVATASDPTMPQVAAPTPSATGKDVLAIYCDAFPNILAHPFDKDGFGGMTLYAEKNIGGDNCLIYDRSGSAPVYTTWGMYDDGDNAIIAATGYSDPEEASHKGVYATSMENLHIDIWSLQACATILVRINDGGTGDFRLSHSGEGWQSYDIPLSEFEAVANINNVRWFKFEALDAITGKIAIDNVYFWKAESGSKSITLSVNNESMGSATAKVDDDDVSIVTTGTEVTFAATPEEGYDFVYWTINGDRVYTNPYALEITANTNAVATFETHRTEYCSTLITDAGHSSELYVSIVNPSTNTYKILLEGTASQKIESAYNNIQLALTHINGESGTTYLPAASWTVDNSGYGSAYVTFTATDFRDITFVNKYITLNKQGGGLIEFDAFPNADLIKWDATCADNVAPELANPTAESIGSSQVRLTLSAIDDVAAVLTYHINYKPTDDAGEGENVDVVGASGETVHKVITGLTTSVEYTFTVTVSDAKPNTSAAKVCTATPTMPTAPVPTRDAAYVRSIYSDAYESVIVSNYGKNSYTEIEYSELNIDDDHFILYDYSTQKEIVWGADNENSDAMLAAEGYTYGTKKGLDVRGMNFIHFDVYSTTATTYPNLYVQNVQFPFSVDDSGWQSFDINISNLDETVAQSITMLKFNDFRTPKPDEIAIDNVYFYAVPANISFGDDATDNTTTIADNANKYANVTINRNISADGTWYTLCLPFDMDADKVSEEFGASTIATLVSSEDRGSLIHLNFDYVNAIEAGKPYLIKPGTSFVSGSTISNVQIKNVDPSAEGYKAIATHMHFQGTFNKIVLTGEDKRYVSANNELYSPNPNGGSKIGAFRCFFTIPEGSSALAPGRVAKIVFGEQTATGIDQMGVDAKSNGKLLINGVLYIIRDGKTYNAQGILIQ